MKFSGLEYKKLLKSATILKGKKWFLNIAIKYFCPQRIFVCDNFARNWRIAI
jgi:hypothetical protein